MQESANGFGKPNLQLLPAANTYTELINKINSYLLLSKKLNKYTALAHYFVGENLSYFKENYKAGGIKNMTTWHDAAKEYCNLSEKVANGYISLFEFYSEYKRFFFIEVCYISI